MNILATARLYIGEMVTQAGPQMKVLLMDKETTGIVSCAFAQSEMMHKEVYLFERIDNAAPRENIKHLKCIVFVRPTAENIQLLCRELRSPKYAQYYIFFSNIANKSDIKLLAEADEEETVREVHEFFIDAVPLSKHLLSIGLHHPYDASLRLSTTAFLHAKQTIISLLLAFKKAPTVCYQKSNGDCEKLADEVTQVMRREEALFRTCKEDTLLLVIDRSEDCATPLLNQWTYEAMVHELLGLQNNRVTLDGQSLVLSELQDEFYEKNVNANFGEIGQSIKQLMEQFQSKAQIHKNVESIADMKSFVEEYPQFKKMSGTVSKHVSIVGELSRLVAANNLLEVSELEQSIVVDGDHTTCLDRVRNHLVNKQTTVLNATRLVLLYALRFEQHQNNDIDGVVALLRSKEPAAASLVRVLLRFGGASRRKNDLFGSQSAVEMTKRFIKGLKGVENVYTQHTPYLTQIIESIARGRFNENVYPKHTASQYSARVDNIIVFVIGGATYAELAQVRAANERRNQAGGPSVLLATTHMLNAQSFIDQLREMGGTTR
ncbi:unnamed protein product, partial [Mesorhabditis belari]|uniref:Vacuolar protein sorting-associated protein 45 n=1 Tax=Mesorhabditis belari TaxID=2138241 RepID=A0AAF3ESW4_9BILA